MTEAENGKLEKESLLEQHIQNDAASEAKPAAVTKELKWSGGHYSPKAFRFRFICLTLLTLAAVYFGWKISSHYHTALIWGLFLGIPAILWCWILIVVWYKSVTIKYILEEDRLICKNGLFRQTTNTILVPQMNDIQLVQTLWDRLVNGGVGTIIMHTTDVTDPVLTLDGLERPQDAFDSLDLLRKEYVRKRGIKSFGTTLIEEDGGSGAAAM